MLILLRKLFATNIRFQYTRMKIVVQMVLQLTQMTNIIPVYGRLTVLMSFKNKKSGAYDLPCKFTTCCCFGGENMNKLFVTSAFNDTNDCGNIHILDLDCNGIKEPVFSHY